VGARGTIHCCWIARSSWRASLSDPAARVRLQSGMDIAGFDVATGIVSDRGPLQHQDGRVRQLGQPVDL